MLHVSATNWGNVFSLEIFGEKGFLAVDGLGRRYGIETLTLGKRKEKFGDVKRKIFTFPEKRDASWEKEWKNFIDVLEKKTTLVGNMHDGLRANEIVEAIYRSSLTHKEVKIN